MEYILYLNPRPFEAIKKGTKKIEGRTPTEHNKHISFDKIKKGDFLIFINNETQEKMKTKVLGVRHYSNVRKMLETEGVENVLSSKSTIEEGIRNYNKFRDYKNNIKKFGIYAIEIKPIKLKKVADIK
jgi:ASC-1-like (ASCH) protein